MIVVKRLARRIAPRSMLDSWSGWDEQRSFDRHVAAWEMAKSTARRFATKWPPRRVLLVPADPRTLVGSRGEEAMIAVFAQTVLAAMPDAIITVLTQTEEASLAAEARGYVPLRLWGRPDFVPAITEMLAQQRPDAVMVLGADVLDGHYGARGAAKMLIVADLAARCGIPSTVLGFSFNNAPSPALKPIFDNLHDDVVINLRDPISLERFRAFTRAKPTLVADTAFLMPPEPSPAHDNDVRFVEERRAAGQAVVAVNLHPTLFKGRPATDLTDFVERMAEAMAMVSASRPVTWILLPHDFRENEGDGIVLNAVGDVLRQKYPNTEFHAVQGVHSAPAIKAFGHHLDGVVAGRMHLTIGCLGGGVPVMALIYQDKFEGLYRHFDLPSWLLLDPHAATLEFAQAIQRFVDELPALRAQILRMLPQVIADAHANYAGLAEPQLDQEGIGAPVAA
ncbi:Polysaccharide pyruvyl transferase family protein WcaK [Arboricoccus pini]|uniref:Polysaccharide pyruvyl transferase family protein WcaK n=1 Tax=Arboricoccus pini TaxID=1963835 RepID=A0A212QU25_9PROT|nr:polysaccharide pyruvyl transferase family protein [Arboricoccus pini]SNB63163.1 Polysaccharide pyruvyl transferase family protein WcaK [Arboricoccus pini]